jgi:hypothetical protein
MARPGLSRHRKFLRLARALGSPVVARGALELLWDCCYECGEDYVGTAEDVESMAGWQGEPGVLAKALLDAGAPEGAGFIEPVEPGATRYRVHDLWHHAPDYVSNRRSRERERQVSKTCGWCGTTYHSTDANSKYCSPACRTGGWRDRKTGRSDASVTPRDANVAAADVTRDASVTPRDTPPAPAPAPAPAPKKEKSVSSPPQTATEPTPASPPVLHFPVVGSKDPTWALTQRQVDEWTALYPGLEVLAESRKALAWLAAKPQNRKTAGGMPRFLVSWLNRAVNDRPRGPTGPAFGKTAGNLASLQRFAARGGAS